MTAKNTTKNEKYLNFKILKQFVKALKTSVETLKQKEFAGSTKTLKKHSILTLT